MKLLVCVKEVQDPESPVTIDETTGFIAKNTTTSFRMNRYDEYALEEAVQIKERLGNTTIDIVSVGIDRVRATLKKGLEKGADTACLIKTSDDRYISAHQTASLLASYARDKGYDLILAGVMAEDDNQCMVGPLTAAYLSMPCAVSVISESLDPKSGTITTECEIEGGLKEQVLITMPCLLTVQSGINRPRYPSLSNVLRARSQEVPEIEAESLAVDNETTISLSYPPVSDKGIILDGTREEKAEHLIQILHEKSFL